VPRQRPVFFPLGSAFSAELSEAMLFSDVMDQKDSGLGPPFEGNEWPSCADFNSLNSIRKASIADIRRSETTLCNYAHDP
jgi:hypothetical protein